MVLEELNTIYNPWSFLQQPSHASSGINPSFRSLLAAIDQGWQVENPVQVLPMIQMDAWTYYFVLFHPAREQTCWMFLPAVPEVERFVEQNHYQVIEGSLF